MTVSQQTSPPAPRPALPIVAAAVTVLLWASAFVGIRQVGHEMSAGALSLGRLGVGSIVLGIMVLTRESVWPTAREWRLLILCGVAWFGIYNLALNEAERHMDAGIAAMLVNIGPMFIAVLAGLILGEGFPRGLISGGLIALAGVVVIGISTSSGAHADALGILLCLVGAISYATGVVSQKPLLNRLPPLTVTWLACTIGAAVCLPFAPTLVHEAKQADPSTLALILYLGVFPTAVAFTTWAYALRRTTAGRMGATTYLVPPLAILLGWLLLGEQPTALALIGGGLCLIGVAITRRRGRVLATTPE